MRTCEQATLRCAGPGGVTMVTSMRTNLTVEDLGDLPDRSLALPVTDLATVRDDHNVPG